jgi:hypothetical protein
VCDAQTFTLYDAQDYAICEIWPKAFLDIKNFAYFDMCKCGAVVECEARDLGDTSSRPACVLPFSTDAPLT